MPDNLQDLMRMAERLGDDAVDKKEPGGEVKPAKVGKDNNSWQKRKKCKKDKHVHEKFEPKPNNAPKGGKPKPLVHESANGEIVGLFPMRVDNPIEVRFAKG